MADVLRIKDYKLYSDMNIAIPFDKKGLFSSAVYVGVSKRFLTIFKGFINTETSIKYGKICGAQKTDVDLLKTTLTPGISINFLGSGILCDISYELDLLGKNTIKMNSLIFNVRYEQQSKTKY